MTTTASERRTRPPEKPRPLLLRNYCKACGRCISACSKQLITFGTTIDPETGLLPVEIDLEACNGCGVCFEACPEPFSLLPQSDPLSQAEAPDPASFFEERPSSRIASEALPTRRAALPPSETMLLKGTHASAIGALLAGCRHFFGYPITPSTEGAELLARLLPGLGGVFVQAVSEVAAVNMMYGCGGAGRRAMTFTSSPGFSLMLEGISYMIGAEVPGVFVDVMRGGPGLGNIAPEQSDIKLVCRGLGHGNTHALVLAPSTPQEMLDLTMEAFDLSFRYRNPVILASDGFLGQMMGRVTLPTQLVEPGLPAWAVYGDGPHRCNLINSIYLDETDLERHNIHLNAKYARMQEAEQRADLFFCDDAQWIVVASNTPARMAKGAVRVLRHRGVRAGLFRPVTLWPFPVQDLIPLLDDARGLLVVEAGSGQLEDELRLALSRGAATLPRIEHVQHYGGVLPQQDEIVRAIERLDHDHQRQ